MSKNSSKKCGKERPVFESKPKNKIFIDYTIEQEEETTPKKEEKKSSINTI